MNKYETAIIINPELSEDEKTATVDKIKTLINNEGKVTNEDVWGLRKLAYPIQKHNEGYYVLFEFEATPEYIDEINRVYNITDEIIKHIIVKKD